MTTDISILSGAKVKTHCAFWIWPSFHSCGPTFLPVTGFITPRLWLLSAPFACPACHSIQSRARAPGSVAHQRLGRPLVHTKSSTPDSRPCGQGRDVFTNREGEGFGARDSLVCVCLAVLPSFRVYAIIQSLKFQVGGLGCRV